MRSTWIVYQKEMLESARSYKLIWIPVVFIILGIMQPLVSFYMLDILKASGDMPPGLLEGFEMPGAAEVMAKALGQYGSIGMLILVLGSMNSLAGERYSGTAELVLVRPLSSSAFVVAKWAAQLTLLILALGLGAAGAGYYTWQLIGALSWSTVMLSALLYGLWLMCAISLTLLFSAFLRPPAAAFLALLSAAGLSLAYSLLPSWFGWSPAALSGLSAQILVEGTLSAWVVPCVSAAAMITLCIAAASLLTRRNKLPNC